MFRTLRIPGKALTRLFILCLLTFLTNSLPAAELPAGMQELLGVRPAGKDFSILNPNMLKAFGFSNIKEGDAVQILPGKNGSHRIKVLGTGEEREISLNSSPSTGQTIRTENGVIKTSPQGSYIKQGGSIVKTNAQGTDIQSGQDRVRTTADGSLIQSGNTTVRTSHEGGTTHVQTEGAIVDTSENGSHVKAGDNEVRTDEDSTYIRSGDTEIQTGPNGVTIKTPGVTINADGDMDLDMNELIPNMNVGDDY